MVVFCGGALGAAALGCALLGRLGAGWCDPVCDEVVRGGEVGERLKVHLRPVPLVGGVAVLLAVVAASVAAGVVTGDRRALVVAVAGLVGLLPGAWDDFRWKRLSVPGAKFALQLAAAGVVSFVGCVAGALLVPWSFGLSWLAGAGFVVAGMNAFNLEDGMDGLCGGEALLAAAGCAVWGYRGGVPWVGFAALLVGSALAGFLVFNWHPARVFLGDAGSHLVGALVALLALLLWARAGARGFVPAVLVVGLPVFGAAWVVVARLVSGRRLFAGDRMHLYDRLRRTRLGTRGTALVCWAAQAALVAAGVLMSNGLSMVRNGR